ncbi:MAG: glutathione S-transferase protein [Herbaspirillum sp.]|nr:glutathione S-transferase protein [Herbaspirillum sp.]
MMKIYGRLSSINVQKVIWCLDELGKKEGVDYERIDAGLQFGVNKTDAYLKMNPNGLVPTLVDGDFVLWESNAIVRYLASLHGGSLFPADLKIRADADRWMDWTLVTLWPTLRVSFLGLTRTPKEQQDIPLIIKHYQDTTRLLQILEDLFAGRAYCAGEQFTVGDITLALAVDRWVKLPASFPDLLGELPELKSLMAWHRKVTARPAFIKLLQNG